MAEGTSYGAGVRDGPGSPPDHGRRPTVPVPVPWRLGSPIRGHRVRGRPEPRSRQASAPPIPSRGPSRRRRRAGPGVRRRTPSRGGGAPRSAPAPRGDLQDDLVVDLEEHPGLQTGLAQRPVDVQHRDLHDVRGRALDRRVQRHAFGRLAPLTVVTVQVGQIAAPPEQGLRVARGPRLVHDPAQIVPDTPKRSKYVSIRARASPASMFSCWDRPNADSPYARPYDMALILRRISASTAERSTENTWDATVVCRSSPR